MLNTNLNETLAESDDDEFLPHIYTDDDTETPEDNPLRESNH
jgi:hypothetical protein